MKTATRMDGTGAKALQGWVWLAGCLVLLMAWHAGPLTAAERQSGGPQAPQEQEGAPYNHALEVLSQPNEQGEYSYIVDFAELSVTEEQAQRLRPKMPPEERRKARFDPLDAETVAYRKNLEARQLELIAIIEGELGREIRVTTAFGDRIYTWLTPDEAERVAHIPGISRVGRQGPPRPLDSDQSRRTGTSMNFSPIRPSM